MKDIRYKTLSVDDLIHPYTDPIKEKRRQDNIQQMSTQRKVNIGAVSPVHQGEDEDEMVFLDDLEMKSESKSKRKKKSRVADA